VKAASGVNQEEQDQDQRSKIKMLATAEWMNGLGELLVVRGSLRAGGWVMPGLVGELGS